MNIKIIISTAVQSVHENKGVLARALFIPFLLYMAISAIDVSEKNWLITTIMSLLSIGAMVLIAIPIHRVILLGPDSVSKWGLNKWSKREMTFALYLIVVTFIVVPIALLAFFISLIPVLGIAFVFLIMPWISGRLSLAFPAIAIDGEASFKKSWELTKNHQLLMYLVVIFFPMVSALPLYLLSSIPHTFLFISFIHIITAVYEVAALSTAYKFISADRAQTLPPQEAQEPT